MGHLWDFSSALQCPVPASAGRRPALQCISASQCQAFGWHSSAQCRPDGRPGPAVASATLHCVQGGSMCVPTYPVGVGTGDDVAISRWHQDLQLRAASRTVSASIFLSCDFPLSICMSRLVSSFSPRKPPSALMLRGF